MNIRQNVEREISRRKNKNYVVTTIDVCLRKLVKSPSYSIKLFRDIRMTSLVALHVSDFVKKNWLMITLLNFFESPIKPLTSILRFVNLGYLPEINLGLVENFEGGRWTHALFGGAVPKSTVSWIWSPRI